MMRTTLDIDGDVLLAAKEIARQRGSTAGRVLSDLARRGLMRTEGETRLRNGVPVLPSRGEIVTIERVQRIADDEGV